MKQELHIAQLQTLSPQVIQSLEVLQMNAQELSSYLQQIGQENPVVELSFDQERDASYAPSPRGEMEWMAATDRQNQWYHRQDAQETKDSPLFAGPEESITLAEHVIQQISAEGDAQLERAVRMLAEHLDVNGWLSAEPEDVARVCGLPEDKVWQALELIQHAEPAGVGARNLRECLLLQLRRQPRASTLTVRIVSDYLPDLAKSHYNNIARALRVSQAEVRHSLEEIRALDPRPGSAFAPAERTVYVTPDILVVPGPNGLEVVINEIGLPQINISEYYVRILHESDSAEVREYLDGKVRQAKWLMGAIQQRRETVLRCVHAIIRLQQDYFFRGGAIRPMVLADVAQLMEVHESTVSRAIRGKWLQSPEGIVPMSKFFSRRLASTPETECSAEEAKRLLKKLLMEEDPSHPRTDQRLCELLANDGCVLARRTVAKYRSEMGFPSATARKR